MNGFLMGKAFGNGWLDTGNTLPLVIGIAAGCLIIGGAVLLVLAMRA
ncbi:unnamed protein product, partial [marine sediment metagenome]